MTWGRGKPVCSAADEWCSWVLVNVRKKKKIWVGQGNGAGMAHCRGQLTMASRSTEWGRGCTGLLCTAEVETHWPFLEWTPSVCKGNTLESRITWNFKYSFSLSLLSWLNRKSCCSGGRACKARSLGQKRVTGVWIGSVMTPSKPTSWNTGSRACAQQIPARGRGTASF